MLKQFLGISAVALTVIALAILFPRLSDVRLLGSLGGGWCTETYVYGGNGPEPVAENPTGYCTFHRYHYMVVHCPVNTSVHLISCTAYDGQNGSGQPSGDCMYRFNQSGTDENGAPYYLGQPLYYMGSDNQQSAVVSYECITYNGTIGGDGGSSDNPVSSAASFNSQNSLGSSVGPNNVSSQANSSSPQQSSAPASSAAPSSQPPTSSQASSVCTNCTVQSSSRNSSRNFSANSSQPASSSACSLRPEIPVVCGTPQDVCSDPPGRQAACSQSCVDAELACRRAFYAQQSSVRNPAGCQYAEPSPNLYEACTRPRMECDCNCQVNIVPSLCASSSQSSASSASTIACPAGAFCGTTKECAQANASYVMPPSFCGTADAGTHCCKPSTNECPQGYSCMDKQVCLDKGGVNNGTGMCGGTDSTTCCQLPNSSHSSSSTGEEWVFTPCPGDTQTDPVLCIMGLGGKQVCPSETVPYGGTCKNTKYENGTIVAQAVGICCGTGKIYSSQSSSSTTGTYCCLPSLNYSCLLVSTPQVCQQSQGIPGGSTLAGCQQTCKGDSSASNSNNSSSSHSVIVDPPPSSSSRSSVSPASSSSSHSTIIDSSRSSSRSTVSASSQSSIIVVGGQCLGNECSNGGNTFCALSNETCTLTNTFPCLVCTGGNNSSNTSQQHSSSFSSKNNNQSSSVIVVLNPSSSSTPFLECSGNECATVGNSFCALQNLSCIPQSTSPCFSCGAGNNLPPGSPCTDDKQCSSNICENGICQEPLPPGFPCTNNHQCSTNLCKDGICQNPLTDALAFLGETCTNNIQCITNLCRNNLCVACTQGSDCSSGLCRNGICLNNNLPAGASCDEDSQCLSRLCLNNICTNPSTLPATAVIDPVTGKPLLSASDDPSLVLPATVIELPFTSGDQFANNNDLSEFISSANSSAPSTPSTGPAALAVMIAGGAAGWLYRRRR